MRTTWRGAVPGALPLLVVGTIGMALPDGAEAMDVPRLERGARAVTAAGQAHLESVAYRIGEAAEGDRRPLDLQNLQLGFGTGETMPALAVAPAPTAPDRLADRIAGFFSGVLRWVGGRFATDQASAGADIEVGRNRLVGFSLGMVRHPETENDVTSTTVAAYAVHRREDFTAHLVAGGGRARVTVEGTAARGTTLFTEAGAAWRLQAGPIGLTPAARLGLVSGSAVGGSEGRRRRTLLVSAVAGLTADRTWRFEAGDLSLSAEALYQTPLSDGRQRPGSGAEVQMGALPAQRGRAGLRLGARFLHLSGAELSLDHTVEPRAGGADGHGLRAGLRIAF